MGSNLISVPDPALSKSQAIDDHADPAHWHSRCGKHVVTTPAVLTA